HIAVTIDGSKVENVDWSLVPDPGASVVFCIVPKIAAAAGAIAAWAVSAFAVSGAVATVIYYASKALMYLATYLVNNMIMQASQPGGQGAGGDNSPTYGWGGAQGNYPYQGGAVPVPYGTMRIVPPMIGMFVETAGGKQYLNMLYLVAGCRVDAITGIRINQAPIEQYGQKGLAVYTRLGDLDQAPIPFFSEPVDIVDRTFNPDTDYDAWRGTTRSEQAVGVKLKHGEWTTRFTDGNTVEGLSVALNCRRGLGNIGKGIAAASVAVMVEYRKQGVQAWTPIVTLAQNVTYGRLSVTGSRWSAGYYNMEAGEFTTGWVELEAGSANKADHYENAPYKPAVPVKVPIVGHTYWGWHWIDCAEKFYNEQTGVTTSGADTQTVEIGTLNLSYIPQNYCVLDGSTTNPVYKSVSTPQRLDPGQYEVRAARVAPSAGVLTVLDDVWWDTLGEWTYDKFTYPGCALLAIRIEATDELSGSVPLIDCIVSRNSVEVWNPHTEAIESRAANCHAWASYDVLHNADYGAGEPGENFDFDDFDRWAAWTQSKGWKCNLYLDQTADVATALAKIAATGAGCTIKLGKRHVCIVDSPEQTGVCRFLFTPGNMEADSYSEEYLPVMDRANRLEITYYDEENNYEKTPMIVKTLDSDLSPLPVQSIALDLIGCTARIQAVQIGNMLLKANKYLTLVAKWRAGVDSLGCRIGDVVEVQVFGGGGRIVAATSTTARLDTRVDPAGTSAVVVKHADDSMEKKAVTGLISDPEWETGIAYIIGDYISHLGVSWRCIQAHTASAQQPAGDGRWWTQTGSGVNIAGVWQQVPALYDLYSFGLEAEATKLMRIINIEKDQDLYKKITAIEYLPQIYNDDMAVTIEVGAPGYQDVRHLSAQEAWSMQGGGSFVMVLSWLGAAIRWQVYYRVTGASPWTLAGETTQPFFLVAALIPGTEYEFCVTTGSNQGRGKTITRTFWGVPTTTNPDGDPIEGAPPVPSGLKIVRQGANMLLSWSAVEGGAFPITGYDVRVGTTILATNRAE
ncbi:MAG TPA: phage tail protein, partial [Sedimentisphaerales bacterium]|nr:phage tail protein [Sedimentisphaerales bacterium]